MHPSEPNPPSGTDDCLVAAAQAGNAEAFDQLVDRHLDSIHAFVAFKLPVPHVVDELTQETFVFAFHHLHEFTAGSNVRAWLRAIATQKVRAELERYHREERNRLAYAEQRAVDRALGDLDSERSGELEALEDCLQRVPENLRNLLHLKYHEDNSSAEIARRLERTLAWVHTTLCRLRQQLRECLERKLKSQPYPP